MNFITQTILTFLLISSIVTKAYSQDTITLIIPTFLGNYERNYYGNDCPSALKVVWKTYLGEGITVISRKIGEKKWKGAGWTGQPLLFKEGDEYYLIQGSYDHNLKKINASTGNIVWQYEFDDVIKGTGTYFYNRKAQSNEEKHIILQGSRLGVGNFLDSEYIPSYRAISYTTGKELWRLDVKWTDSYSRDADGSALIIDTLAYIGLENSLFTILDPNPAHAAIKDKMLQPKILAEHKLYTNEDVLNHGIPKISNIVTESSPALLGNHIYISSGSGHLYGYNIDTDKLDWDFYIGSDIDGSPIITSDSCILLSIEKQYIKGHGGVYKFNPTLPPDSSVVWFFPTKSYKYASWEGGIVSSVAINDNYNNGKYKSLAAFSAIDGYIYVVDYKSIDNNMVLGTDGITMYHKPKLLFSYFIDASISTPIFVDNKLIAASYNGIYLFEYNENYNFKLLDFFPGEFEATPISFNNKIYIASRNGYLYCFGK